MALNQEEIECLSLSIIHQLSQTPYACTSLKMLSGGTANFLFRGSLMESLPHGRKTVVVKHSKEFVSANRDFKLNISRCVSVISSFPAPMSRIHDLVKAHADTNKLRSMKWLCSTP
jgi:hypothetical protein